ncbi:hypothetical protein ACOMHN_018084 [Nucella lapillus]
MNIFKKSRSRSPSFEIPKLCLPKLPRQKRSTSVDSSVSVSTSLIVPLENRGRSSSFDSSSLRDVKVDFLQVPPPPPPRKTRGGGGSKSSSSKSSSSKNSSSSRRSHSFDTAAPWSPISSDDNFSDKENSSSNNLKLPKHQTRRASLDIPKICMHCVHLEAIEQEREKNKRNALFYLGDTQNSSSTTPEESSSAPDSEDDSGSSFSNDDSEGSSVEEQAVVEIIETLHHSPSASPQRSSKDSSRTNSYTDVVTLAVPVMKQRSSSMDAGYITKPPESPRKASLDERTLHKVHAQIRSQSLDQSGGHSSSRLRDQSLAWLASLHQSVK